tara:strand:+ start:8173 stop:10986 length:2814 start_codon:yes stop_codon:yes gene_type:complete
METNTLLKAVLGDTGHYCLFAAKTSQSKRVQKFYKDLDTLIEDATDLDSKGYDVYYALSTFVEEGSRKADNAAYLRSFFLDIDCGLSKDYPSKMEAYDALRTFCSTLKLPRPVVVDSGRGLHVYWPLTEDIIPEDWVVAAENLKKQCAKHNFYADPAVTSDIARVLRVPNTHNHKTDPPSKVMGLGKASIELYDFDKFSSLLGVDFVPAPTRPAPKAKSTNAVMDALLGNRESRFKDILKKTQAGRGCEQIKLIVKDQENTSEPMWRAGLSIARYCADGDKAAHLLSKNHPEYSQEATDKKYGPIKGPYTCTKFDEFRPDVCPKCPNWGKVKSPIVLGNRFKEASYPVEIDEDSVDTNTIPEYPYPYFRGASGGVYMRTTNADGDIDEKQIYHNDLYVTQRIIDPEQGESVVMRLHLPKDGVKEFSLPLSAVTSREEFRKSLSAQGVAVMKMDELMSYTTTWINELQSKVTADEAHRQFGWANEKMDSFVLGNQLITKRGTVFNAPTPATVSLFPAFEPKGELDAWKEALGFWNRDGFELYQYVLGTGFGSALMELSNVKCSAMHLHNKDSGVAKTTAMIAAVSIWGDPDALVLGENDTLNSKMNRGEVYHSLPWAIDEITEIEPKKASELIYMFTSGKQKNRMSNSSNVERYRGKPWSLLAITTGNTSIIERVCLAKTSPKAEAQRVLECYVPDVTHLFSGKEETDNFEKALKENYGHAGPIFAKYVIDNLEEIREMCLKIQKNVDLQGDLKAPNRFWSAHITYTLAGLIIAKKLGLIQFDISKIFKWVLRTLLPQNKNSTIAAEASVHDVMNGFFTEHISNILQIESTRDNRKVQGNGLDELALPESLARGKLVARYETDTHRFYVVPKILKAWCGEQQINYGHLVGQIKETCEGKRSKMRLTKGTKMKLPSADVLVMTFNVDGDEVEESDTEEL